MRHWPADANIRIYYYAVLSLLGIYLPKDAIKGLMAGISVESESVTCPPPRLS